MVRIENYLIKKSIWKNQHLWSWNLGLCTHCGQLQNHVRIANFSWENWKTSILLRIFVFLHGLWMWRLMQRNVWNDIVSFQKRRLNKLYTASTPCIDDHYFKEEETKSVGELSQVCSQIVLKCFHLARNGRPDIFWSVNKLARSIIKWTKACDKRLNRLISYIHHTSEYKQYCHVGNTAKQCRLGLFQDSDFAGDLEDSKSTSGGTLCVLEVEHLFQ